MFFVAFPSFAQENEMGSGPFLRIYDFESKKILKGKFLSVSDDFEVLRLLKGADTVGIQTNSISYIITKRSPGHLILIGGAIGFVGGAVLGFSQKDPNARLYWGYDLLIPGVFFGLGGAALGALGSGGKKSRIYSINGKTENMEDFNSGVLVPISN